MKAQIRNIIKTGLLLTAFTVVSQANAGLFLRDGGMVYDDVLDITWLQDANYAKTSGYDDNGLMSWEQANTWVDNLVYGGYDDWRLFNVSFDFSHCINNSLAWSNDSTCQDAESVHLFYEDFGLTPGQTYGQTTGEGRDNYNLFTNIGNSYYWSGTQNLDTGAISVFAPFIGFDAINYPAGQSYAWAVLLAFIPFT
ncbi:hypothetical protein [Thalassomonas sp. RHCl1]|uniref:hypothetical protein n=1 Tax=Thalassomonas sp. RHCl1 TaxID=2995320 RepID=UPI00248CACFF|nr:hypothetical protein [Thalassomonas sp. RHCl1]